MYVFFTNQLINKIRREVETPFKTLRRSVNGLECKLLKNQSHHYVEVVLYFFFIVY